MERTRRSREPDEGREAELLPRTMRRIVREEIEPLIEATEELCRAIDELRKLRPTPDPDPPGRGRR